MTKKEVESNTISKFTRDTLNWALSLCRHWEKHSSDDIDELWQYAEKRILEIIIIHYLDTKNYLHTHNIFSRLLENYRKDQDYLEEDYIENEIARWRRRLCEQFPITIFKNNLESPNIENKTWEKIIVRLLGYSSYSNDHDLWGVLFQAFRGYKLVRKNGNLSLKKSFSPRRADGFFFTPPKMVKYMLETTLEQHLARIEKYHGLQSLEAISNLKILDPACGAGIFLSEVYRVLSRFYQKINRQRMAERGKILSEQPDADLFTQRQLESEIPEPVVDYHKRIFHQHIFGIDTDSGTIELCELNILLTALGEGLPMNRKERFPSPSKNLRVGNALYPVDDPEHSKEFYKDNEKELLEIERLSSDAGVKEKYQNLKNDLYKKYFEKYPCRFDEGDQAYPFCWAIEFPQLFRQPQTEDDNIPENGFDFILGNPPWSSLFFSRFSKQQEPVWAKYFQQVFPFLGRQKRISSSMIFLARGIGLLRPKGQLAFVINQEFLTVQAYRRIREFVLSKTLINRMVERVDFQGVNINASIIFLTCPDKLPPQSNDVEWYGDEEKFVKKVSQEEFLQNFNCNFAVSFWDTILKPPRVATVPLQTIAEVSTGMCITREDFCSDTPIDNHWHPGVFGSNVSRYELTWPSEEQTKAYRSRKPYLCYDVKLLEEVNKKIAAEGRRTVKVLGSD